MVFNGISQCIENYQFMKIDATYYTEKKPKKKEHRKTNVSLSPYGTCMFMTKYVK